jgi:hypothetical protein
MFYVKLNIKHVVCHETVASNPDVPHLRVFLKNLDK